MKNKHSSIPVILFAFCANLVIAIIKFTVAFITRSSAMLAEAVHSLADTLNQVFLIIGIKRADKKPNPHHPFGYSGELYFWSFIVAILLFTAGAVFSIYEGVSKISHPEQVKNIGWAIIVLVVAIFVEGIAFKKASSKIHQERKGRGILEYLKYCKHSELIVVFLEDFAALCGLGIALIFILIQYFTNILILDGIASVIIGILLAVVAYFLARETQSLLIGEGADPKILQEISGIFTSSKVQKVIYIKSLQLGPEDILLGIKLEFFPFLQAKEISKLINEFEKQIRSSYPCIKEIFIEPDIYQEDNK